MTTLRQRMVEELQRRNYLFTIQFLSSGELRQTESLPSGCNP